MPNSGLRFNALVELLWTVDRGLSTDL